MGGRGYKLPYSLYASTLKEADDCDQYQSPLLCGGERGTRPACIIISALFSSPHFVVVSFSSHTIVAVGDGGGQRDT